MFALLLFVVICNAQTIGGSWTTPIYEQVDKVNVIYVKQKEMGDAIRHILDKIDHAKLDLEAALPKQKATILAKIHEMEGSLLIIKAKKSALVKKMITLVNAMPEPYKRDIIRKNQIEGYFE